LGCVNWENDLFVPGEIYKLLPIETRNFITVLSGFIIHTAVEIEYAWPAGLLIIHWIEEIQITNPLKALDFFK
jgi:hypothetical protein